MNTVHKKLHLQHRRHTARLLHHRHTSYRGLAIILVLAGVVIVGLNLMARATADSLYVYATVPAQIPTTAPVIQSPTNGNVHTADFIVRGTCPFANPRVIIDLLIDNSDAGSAACSTSNIFAIPVSILPGAHTFIARVYTITGDQALDSTPVYVTYIVLADATDSNRAHLHDSSPDPLYLTEAAPFIVFGPAKDAEWVGAITGGAAPYHLKVDWGDGTTTNYTVTDSDKQTIRHHYSSMQPYDITMTATDKAGRQVVHHYAAVTPFVPPVAGLLGPTYRSPFTGSLLLGSYGFYLVLLAVCGWLWVHQHEFAFVPVVAGRKPRRRANGRMGTTRGRPQPTRRSR